MVSHINIAPGKDSGAMSAGSSVFPEPESRILERSQGDRVFSRNQEGSDRKGKAYSRKNTPWSREGSHCALASCKVTSSLPAKV